ncbi:hypothetical protein CK203_051435 [Vitis vinifera]|uniref:Reverse transcriptase domain-containing protein n=1 Tax=Vitis vinifera TaxID=29760 RepID=A0A438H1F3_VITVI|nr:hypothetical protein CK203_051435 [Vitis vinifera]
MNMDKRCTPKEGIETRGTSIAWKTPIEELISGNRIKINEVLLTEEQEVREGIANAYQQLLSDSSGWKADIGGLQLKQISQSEAEVLELPFSKSEIHATLMEMNGDKAPGPDGFTVAFGKAAGSLSRRKFWTCSRSSMSRTPSLRA